MDMLAVCLMPGWRFPVGIPRGLPPPEVALPGGVLAPPPLAPCRCDCPPPCCWWGGLCSACPRSLVVAAGPFLGSYSRSV